MKELIVLYFNHAEFNETSEFAINALKISIEMKATPVSNYISNYLIHNSPFNKVLIVILIVS